MAKLVLNDLANLQNEQSAVATINANNTATEAAMEKTLSRTGDQPNQMMSVLDMNSNRIINCVDAVNLHEPVTLHQLLEGVVIDIDGVIPHINVDTTYDIGASVPNPTPNPIPGGPDIIHGYKSIALAMADIKGKVIGAGITITLNVFPEVFETASGDIANIPANLAEHIVIRGAPTSETTVTSVASVIGGPGNYDVEINVANATGFNVGDYCTLREAMSAHTGFAWGFGDLQTKPTPPNPPTPVDHATLPGLGLSYATVGPLDGVPLTHDGVKITDTNMSHITIGRGTGTWNANGVVAVGDLVHLNGFTRTVTGVIDSIDTGPEGFDDPTGRVIVVDEPFPVSTPLIQAYWWVTKPKAGTLSTTVDQTATLTIASPCVVTTSTPHLLTAGQQVRFSTTGALPTGVSASVSYFVLPTSLTSTTFRFSTTAGGTAVNTTGSQSGTHTITPGPTNIYIGSGTAFNTDLSKGSLVVFNGQMVKVESVTDNTHFVGNVPSVTSAEKYSVVPLVEKHQGCWEITGKSGNILTLKNTDQQDVPPPAKGLTGATVVSRNPVANDGTLRTTVYPGARLKKYSTVLKQNGPGSGIVLGTGGHLKLLDRICIVGSGPPPSGSIANIALRLSGADLKQPGSIACGPEVAINGWGLGVHCSAGCSINSDYITISNCNRGMYCFDGGTVKSWHSVVSGCKVYGLFGSQGTYAVAGTQISGTGNVGAYIGSTANLHADWFRVIGCTVPTIDLSDPSDPIVEARLAGIFVEGGGFIHAAPGRSIGSGGPGLSIGKGSSCRFTGGMLCGNDSFGAVIGGGSAEVATSWITGNKRAGVSCSGGSSASFDYCAITGNKEDGLISSSGSDTGAEAVRIMNNISRGIHCLTDATVDAPKSYVVNNSGLVRADYIADSGGVINATEYIVSVPPDSPSVFNPAPNVPARGHAIIRTDAVFSESSGGGGLSITSTSGGIDLLAGDLRTEHEQRRAVTAVGTDVIVAADRARFIEFTTAPVGNTGIDNASVLGNGWYCILWNNSTGERRIDPSGAELINGLSPPLVMPAGSVVLLYCNGSNFIAPVMQEAGVTGVTAIGQGKHTMWIPARSMIPRTTNGPSIGAVETATNRAMISTLDFDTTTQEFAQFEVAMPKSWNGSTVAFQPVWSHPATTVNFGVVWGLSHAIRSDNTAIDVAFTSPVQSPDTGGVTNNLYIGPEIVMPVTEVTDSDVIIFQVSRLVSVGTDLMAVDARLHGIKLFYTINAATDA